jgi:hypothetical protein
MVRYNVIPVHHSCHMAYGNTKTMTRRCLRNLCYCIGATQIGKWYVDLWENKNLPIRRGLLVPPKIVKVSEIISRYLPLGSKLKGWAVPTLTNGEWLLNPNSQYQRDYRALAAMRFSGRRIKKIYRPPSEHQGIKLQTFLVLMEEGYYFDYLCRTLGFPAKEAIEWDSGALGR